MAVELRVALLMPPHTTVHVLERLLSVCTETLSLNGSLKEESRSNSVDACGSRDAVGVTAQPAAATLSRAPRFATENVLSRPTSRSDIVERTDRRSLHVFLIAVAPGLATRGKLTFAAAFAIASHVNGAFAAILASSGLSEFCREPAREPMLEPATSPRPNTHAISAAASGLRLFCLEPYREPSCTVTCSAAGCSWRFAPPAPVAFGTPTGPPAAGQSSAAAADLTFASIFAASFPSLICTFFSATFAARAFFISSNCAAVKRKVFLCSMSEISSAGTSHGATGSSAWVTAPGSVLRSLAVADFIIPESYDSRRSFESSALWSGTCCKGRK